MLICITLIGIIIILSLAFYLSKQIKDEKTMPKAKGLEQELDTEFASFLSENSPLGIDEYSAMIGRTWAENHLSEEKIATILKLHDDYQGEKDKEVSFIQNKINNREAKQIIII